LLLCALLISCDEAKKQVQTQEDVYTIVFKEPIRGYNVSVVWHPFDMSRNAVYGPAEVTFEDTVTHLRHVFTTNRFCVLIDLLPQKLFIPDSGFIF
jgi:hypothetical protein